MSAYRGLAWLLSCYDWTTRIGTHMDGNPLTHEAKHHAQAVIVRRGHFTTFALLSAAYADDLRVRLLWDRRHLRDRRRHAPPSVSGEHRHRSRRDVAADWEDLDYVVLDGAPGCLPTEHVPVRSITSAGASREVAHEDDGRLVRGTGGRDTSPATVRVVRRDIQTDVEAALRSDVNVLISGGDPLSRMSLAERIHRRSSRRKDPFIVVDRRLATTLFAGSGSASSSGTRLAQTRPCEPLWASLAREGTFLFEEVADLSWSQQEELLAFLECHAGVLQQTDREAHQPRIIAATGHWLFDRVASKRFRADLFYRLNAIHLLLPSGTVRAA